MPKFTSLLEHLVQNTTAQDTDFYIKFLLFRHSVARQLPANCKVAWMRRILHRTSSRCATQLRKIAQKTHHQRPFPPFLLMFVKQLESAKKCVKHLLDAATVAFEFGALIMTANIQQRALLYYT